MSDPRALLRRTGEALFGDQWQRPLARALGPHHPSGPRESIDDRRVRHWADGTRPIEGWVWPALRRICDERGHEIREVSALMEGEGGNPPLRLDSSGGVTPPSAITPPSPA